MTDTVRTRRRLLAELVAPRVLPRLLTRFDLVTIYFSLIFGTYGAAQMAGQGWAGIPMLLLAAATFLLPCALAAYELGTLFPGEGGVYIWTHKTFGEIHGFVAGWLSWVPIFLLLPLGATTVVAHLQYAVGASWPLSVQVCAQVLTVWIVAGLSLRRLHISQAFVRMMFFVAIGTAVAVFAAGLMSLGKGTPVTAEIVSLDVFKHGSLYSAAILWLLGVEVPFNMGDEFSEHKKTAGTMLVWGSLLLVAGYLLGIAGVLLSTPVADVDVTIGVAKGVGAVWAFGGSFVAIAICGAVLAQDVAYMNAYSRLLVIAGIERRLPHVMGHVSESSRVPIPAMLVQAAGATIVILVFSAQSHLAVAFNLYLASLVAVWCASLFYIYPAVLIARHSLGKDYVSRKDAVWRIPFGRTGAWVVCVWGTVFNAVAVYYVFASPWTDDVSPGEWRMWLACISGMIVISGVIVFVTSQGSRRRALMDAELARYE